MKITKKKLKQLIVERLIAERKSDATYFSFLDFFFNEVLDLQKLNIYFAPPNHRTWENPLWQAYNPNGNPNEKVNKAFPGIALAVKEQSVDSLWDSYQAYVPPESDAIFGGDEISFKNWIGKFQIGMIKANPKGGIGLAGMAPSGKMYIYNLDKLIPPSRLPGIVKGSSTAIKQTINDIFNNLKTNSPDRMMYALKQMMEHELTHYINTIRAKGAVYRAKGGKKQFVSGSKEYFNSTEEIQANLIAAYRLFNRVSETYGKHLFEKKMWVYNALNEGFIKGAAIGFIERFTYMKFPNLDRNNQKRVIKRVEDFLMNDVANSEEYKAWQIAQIPEV